MGSQHIARVISIEISKDDQSGLDYECLNSLVDDFGFVHQLYFQFEQTDLNAPLEIPAPQIASLLKADRLVYLNGSLYESDNPYPDTATSSRLLLDAKRQKEGICIETRRQIGTYSCCLNDDKVIIDEGFSISKNHGFTHTHWFVNTSLH